MRTDVELREIRVFLTLAQELHFGRTGDRLGIVPSRVSQILRTFETRIGGRLFERTSRHVRLTPLGEQLRRELEPAYAQLQGAVEAARKAASGLTGDVRIGSFARVVLGPYIDDIFELFESRHPDCHARYVDTGADRDYLDWLRDGDVDIIACWLPVSAPEFTIGPILTRDERVLLVACDHPLAKRESVIYEDLAPYLVPDVPAFNREMMDTFVPPVTPSGLRLRRLVRRTPDEALMSVTNGEMVWPTGRRLIEYYSNPRVTAVPLSDLPPLESALVWRRSDRSAMIEAFLHAARDVLTPNVLE